ncbi:MAG: ABC transporter permease [bacterium]
MYRESLEQIGEAGINLSKALWYISRGKIKWKEVAVQIVKTGIGSLFLAAITASFVGLVLTLQLLTQLELFGAERFVGGIVSTSAIRELGPILSAIVVSARVGSAISAEIGSMKASEQIDALIVFGIDPVRYIVVPRLLAAGIITPLLCSLSTILCIFAGMILANSVVNLSYDTYLESVRLTNTTHDVFVMLLKAGIYGITIAIVATTTGLQVRGGAEAVGDAATKTVVWNYILIFIFNYFLSSYFFRL